MASVTGDPTRYDNVKYESLGSPDGTGAAAAKKSRLRANIWPFATGLATAVAAFLIIILVSPHLAGQAKTAAEIEAGEWNSCGRSSAEAMARGCKMEPLFYGWFPAECVFDDLRAKFPVFEDREYYADVEFTQRISSEDLWVGKHKNIYSRRFHAEHCLYQWRKLRYGMEHRQEFLDSKTFSIGHATHCADQLSVMCENNTTKTQVELGFFHCRKTIWS